MKKLLLVICFACLSCSVFSQNGKSALKVVGRQLQDSCGENIVLCGVNHGNIWEMDMNMGMNEFAQMAQIGANCVRICLERTYESWTSGSSVMYDLRGGQIDTIIQAALDQHLIPIVELHDFTSNSPVYANIQNNLDSAVMFWTRPAVMAALKKHSRFLILNFANEPEHGDASNVAFYNACLSSITSIRNAGLEVPLMIDGMQWGQDETFFIDNSNGANLLTADPQHKLLFSIHTYWETATYNDAAITSRFMNMNNANLPFVVGEYAYENGTTGFITINYNLLIDLCQQYQIGNLYWWWGFYNPSSNSNLSMTTTGAFSGLAGIGLEVADSISHNSVRPYLFTNGSCFSGIQDNETNTTFSIAPNPSDGKFTLSIDPNENYSIEIYSLLGEKMFSQTKLQQLSSYEFDLCNYPKGIYLLKMAKAGTIVTKKIVIE